MKIRNHNNGFTLLEVLVTIVIMSIGLLGLAGLQASSIKNNQSADLRTQATYLIYDLADRMRANPIAVAAGNYNPFNPVQNNNCLADLGCSANELAGHDMFEWNTSLANALPSGQGTIAFDNITSIFTITVMWDDARTGAVGTACGPDPAVDLECLSMSLYL